MNGQSIHPSTSTAERWVEASAQAHGRRLINLSLKCRFYSSYLCVIISFLALSFCHHHVNVSISILNHHRQFDFYLLCVPVESIKKSNSNRRTNPINLPGTFSLHLSLSRSFYLSLSVCTVPGTFCMITSRTSAVRTVVSRRKDPKRQPYIIRLSIHDEFCDAHSCSGIPTWIILRT